MARTQIHDLPLIDDNLTADIVRDINALAEATDLINIDIPDASITVKGKVQLSNAVTSTDETKAATSKAVKTVKDTIDNLAGTGRTTETVKGIVDMLNSHLADYTIQTPFVIATGTANAYIATLSPAMASYTVGVGLAIRINIANTGASTINVNGLGVKNILDPKGKAMIAGKLVVNGIYTMRYNGTAFILQGEGGEYGTAVAADIIAGKTAGTEFGIINGTIPVRGSETYAGWRQAVVGQTAPINGRMHLTIPTGAYLTGAAEQGGQLGIYADDANFNSNNIRNGVPMFGMVGTGATYDIGGFVPFHKVGGTRGLAVSSCSFSLPSYNPHYRFAVRGGYAYVGLAGSNGLVRKIDVNSGTVLGSYNCPGQVNGIELDLTGNFVFISSYDSTAWYCAKLNVSNLSVVWATSTVNKYNGAYTTIGNDNNVYISQQGGGTSETWYCYRVNGSTGAWTSTPASREYSSRHGRGIGDSSSNLYAAPYSNKLARYTAAGALSAQSSDAFVGYVHCIGMNEPSRHLYCYNEGASKSISIRSMDTLEVLWSRGIPWAIQYFDIGTMSMYPSFYNDGLLYGTAGLYCQNSLQEAVFSVTSIVPTALYQRVDGISGMLYTLQSNVSSNPTVGYLHGYRPEIQVF
ncbi:phage tail protein [Cohnella sp. WQ 127256]|uniref:phage tail protein n=1 Tax=Cohnella sp. WQ 127256 TaxID=2938790 RepID=UPI00211845D5|nr:phage tail protein [Cohnella sp. WQ 127256]